MAGKKGLAAERLVEASVDASVGAVGDALAESVSRPTTVNTPRSTSRIANKPSLRTRRGDSSPGWTCWWRSEIRTAEAQFARSAAGAARDR
jgi:hypothetical protein